MEVERADAERLLGTDVPSIFFRVFRGSQLVAETSGSLVWRLATPSTALKIPLDSSPQPLLQQPHGLFVVRGRVQDSDGVALRRLDVRAFDRNIGPNGVRDEPLGSATTDERGEYEIRYSIAADSGSSKIKADLVVAGFRTDGSLIAEPEFRCRAPTSAVVDLDLPNSSGQATYEQLMDGITALLRDADVTLGELDAAVVAHVACQSGASVDDVRLLNAAAGLAAESGLPPVIFYGLGAEGFALDPASLLAIGSGRLRDTLERATDANRIPRGALEPVNETLDRLEGWLVERVLADDSPDALIGPMLATGLAPPEAQAAFLAAYMAHDGPDDTFWDSLPQHPQLADPAAVEDFRLTLGLARLTDGNRALLQQFRSLRAEGTLTELADLASVGPDRIRALVEAAGPDSLPDDVPGETADAQLDAYVERLAGRLEEAFTAVYLRRALAQAPAVDLTAVRTLVAAHPTLDPRAPLPADLDLGDLSEEERVRLESSWEAARREQAMFPQFDYSAVLGDGAQTFSNPLRTRVNSVLAALPELDLRAEPLEAYLDAHAGQTPLAQFGEAERMAVVDRLRAIQRVARVTTRSSDAMILLGEGYDSAFDMVRRSSDDFVARVGPALGSDDRARNVYRTASGSVAGAHVVYALVQQSREPLPYAIGGSPDKQAAGKDAVSGVAGYEKLFGQLALCECEHCRSVYSPAAYLVDLLHFLDPPGLPAGKRPVDVLLARRPDIAEILLTCANTNTVMPYIDLVNEVLESYVDATFVKGGGALAAHDTGTATAAELRAVPQYVNDAAYTELRKAVYPSPLPFDRPLAVIRTYLGHLGVRREEIMSRFASGGSPSPGAIAAERLGLSPQQWAILAREPASEAEVREYYGVAPGPADVSWPETLFGSDVPELMRRIGASYAELAEVLQKTWFVNRHQAADDKHIAISSPGADCDLTAMKIANLDWQALSRLHRFLVLQRVLGWSTADLDRALYALNAVSLGSPGVLLRLSELVRLADELALPAAEVLPLFSAVDTWGEGSTYVRLFQNRTIARLHDLEAFRLAYPGGSPGWKTAEIEAPFGLANSGQTLDGHEPALQAALRVSLPELHALRADAGAGPGAPLSVKTLSELYRRTLLARALGLSVARFLALTKLTGAQRFAPADPSVTRAFVERVRRVQQSGFPVETLDYLYRHQASAVRPVAPPAAKVEVVIGAVRDGLVRVAQDTTIDAADGDAVRRVLALVCQGPTVERAAALLRGEKDGYPADAKAFVTGELVALLGADPAEAVTALVHPLPLSDDQRRANVAYALSKIRDRLSRGLITQTVADALQLDPAVARTLLESLVHWPAGTSTAAMSHLLRLGASKPDASHPQLYERLHKTALLVNNLRLNERELRYVAAHPARFGGFDLDALPLTAVGDPSPLFTSWERLQDFVTLRNSLPVGERGLIDIFEAAPGDVLARITEVTDWDTDAVTDVVAATGFGWTAAGLDLRDVTRLSDLQRCLDLSARIGVSPARLFSWAKAAPAPEPWAATVLSPTSWSTVAPSPQDALEVVQVVKARYDEQRWLDVAAQLNDGLRELQRSALVSYLLPRVKTPRPAQSASDLFNHFLMDVEMGACMATSRIRHAISSVQLFVQRCLLNHEAPQVAPQEIDAHQWRTWRGRYRVWEANRKIYLYTENWAAEEFRDDKSPFFRELETALVQNDATPGAVDDALLRYLRSLQDVARLEVCATWWQSDADSPTPPNDVLHVIGRTASSPHSYWYRRHEDRREWTPWEKVPLDIPGDHVIPFVLNARLYLFWPLFEEKPLDVHAPPPAPGSGTPLAPKTHWEVRLAHSERRNGRWGPKSVSLNPLYLDQAPQTYTFRVEPATAIVSIIDTGGAGPSFSRGTFELKVADGRIEVRPRDVVDDITSRKPVGTHPMWMGFASNPPVVKDTSSVIKDKLSIVKDATLELSGEPHFGKKPLLKKVSQPFTVVPPSGRPLHLLPFFYQDSAQTYFAEEVLLEAEPVAKKAEDVGSFLLELKTVTATAEKVVSTKGVSTKVVSTGSSKEASLPPKKHRVRFSTFEHPFVPEFIETVERGGVAALLTLENQLKSREPYTTKYALNYFSSQYKPTELVDKELPRLDVAFERSHPCAGYNWELFFHVPRRIAGQLRTHRRYADAQDYHHYYFDPTTNVGGDSPARFWKLKPFRENTEYDRAQDLLTLLSYTGADPGLQRRKERALEQVAVWAQHPFEPHRIARLRLVAYQKAVVMEYIDNLVDWGDALFAQDTPESVPEAERLYLLGAGILGQRPEIIAADDRAPRTYAQLRPSLDAFSNALVALEGVIAAPTVPVSGADELSGILGSASLYFCTPANDKLLAYWDTIDDRLYKIRHCMNLAGVVRELALFEPPLDPGQLVRAAAAGADLASGPADFGAPLPHRRFPYVIAKVLEFTAELRTIASAFQAAHEKKDVEAMAMLVATHERGILESTLHVKQLQIDEAVSTQAGLESTKAATAARNEHYTNLLKEENRQNPEEKTHLEELGEAHLRHATASQVELHASAAGQAPNVTFGTSGSMGSPVLTTAVGGATAAAILQSGARYMEMLASEHTYAATMAGIRGANLRREEEWTLQVKASSNDLAAIEAQIRTVRLQQERLEQDKAITIQQIENIGDLMDFHREKFSSEELHMWSVSRLAALYFQFFTVVYVLAKGAERVYRFDLGLATSNFIQFGYWDSLKKGLLAADRLAVDLRRMELAWLDQDRPLELTRSISLALHDPASLIALKEGDAGSCEIELPETLFDADNPGHYFRRIKSVSISLPCVTGPHTNVNCTLTLLSSTIRVDPTPDPYRENPSGDTRFLHDFAAVEAIVTSHGQNDFGLFEPNARDEHRYPFEGAGVISRWRIDLPKRANAWDIATLSDIVLRLKFVACPGPTRLREAAQASLDELVKTVSGIDSTGAKTGLVPPLQRLFSIRHEFADEWRDFRKGFGSASKHSLILPVTIERFPWPFRGKSISVSQVDLYLHRPTVETSTFASSTVAATISTPDGSVTGPTSALIPKSGAKIPMPWLAFESLAAGPGEWTLQFDGPILPGQIDDILILLKYNLS